MKAFLSAVAIICVVKSAEAFDFVREHTSSPRHGSLRESSAASAGEASYDIKDYIPDIETLKEHANTAVRNTEGFFNGFMDYMRNVGSYIWSYMPDPQQGYGAGSEGHSNSGVGFLNSHPTTSDSTPSFLSVVNTENIDAAISNVAKTGAEYGAWVKDKIADLKAEVVSDPTAQKVISVVRDATAPLTSSGESANES
ncbi:pyruvate dehydrogenase (acetyl-transferring) homodimeric type protein, putative [Babesia ovata]|uniref:Pyruvate dehydrogenase (Acetyl-transferring) homodimeric type protein, putative n=1 Tax=Babesia ovata TaxID=189622 RepID=A0A2H6KI17_9APIC|nr:pyruvate dehydrogenase (acetyl-transferring) homodimeric type protein, putative [Babesia ovata]GBE62621.1 pyruvate dehydrogenase (acetyl-transferring) homodimeric type protein, putative [Babesia ovata]